VEQVAVIIPVYNHPHYLAEVIKEAKQVGMPIYVVDDGSTDDTAPLLDRTTGITLLRHRHNLGKGAALLTGFAAASGDGYRWAVTLDGDGQHRPEDINRLLAALSDGARCLVVGARQGMENNLNVPWTSSFGRKFSNFWVWASGGPLLADSQSGFRLYPLPEALSLGVQARRYQFEVEILVRAHLQGLTVREAAISVVYQARGERISHFRPWRDFWRNSATFNRLIWARLLRRERR
jgi:glycosyltransferase involved in cell wall biosynthesis